MIATMDAPPPLTDLQDRGVLRFITAGSVDDGKSTLIGRLLYDTKSILSDQLSALARAGERRAAGRPEIDLALLTDGLEAEREQGITIDVAYRYFATARRKFIIADTPGHEQYTRNMVTGASTADAAVLLIDATRVADGVLLPQTRRHSVLARLLGIRHVVIAVNKLDQLGYAEDAFTGIVCAYREMAARLGLGDVTAIPVSALHGDNVVSLSPNTPWYRGPCLLDWLEQVPNALDDNQAARAPLRYPVQLVLRGFEPNARGGSDTHAGGARGGSDTHAGGARGGSDTHAGGARGYAGRVGSGTMAPGQRVRVLPSGLVAQVLSVGTTDGPLALARPGQSVVVRLDRELDISRGDMLVDDDDARQPVLARQFVADLSWLDTAPLAPQRKLWLRHGTRWVQARIRRIDAVLDLAAVEWRDVDEPTTLGPNDIARVAVETQQPIPLDPYDSIRIGGAFILADAATNQTVAAGMVRAATP